MPSNRSRLSLALRGRNFFSIAISRVLSKRDAAVIASVESFFSENNLARLSRSSSELGALLMRRFRAWMLFGSDIRCRSFYDEMTKQPYAKARVKGSDRRSGGHCLRLSQAFCNTSNRIFMRSFVTPRVSASSAEASSKISSTFRGEAAPTWNASTSPPMKRKVSSSPRTSHILATAPGRGLVLPLSQFQTHVGVTSTRLASSDLDMPCFSRALEILLAISIDPMS